MRHSLASPAIRLHLRVKNIVFKEYVHIYHVFSKYENNNYTIYKTNYTELTDRRH